MSIFAKQVHGLYKLEVYSAGDVSYLYKDLHGTVYRMTILKHNGGCLHCDAGQYDRYRADAVEVA